MKTNTRELIDQWPISESGLCARAMHCLAEAGVGTVGELRPWKRAQLLRLRHFGPASLRNVRWFFRWTQHLEQNAVQLPSYRRLMEEFLSKQEIYVLEQRLGLTDPLFRPNMRTRTLQDIADEFGGMTRERVRQIEELALIALRTRLCRQLADTLELKWADRLNQQGGVITFAELGDWVNEPTLGGYQPWGLFWLISWVGGRIRLHPHHYFTTHPLALLDQITATVRQRLQATKGFIPLAELRQEVTPLLNLPAAQMDRLLTVVLDHAPDMAGTLDGRYFVPDHGMATLLAGLMRHLGQPVHFYELTRMYNERARPNSQVGTGHILRALLLMPNVRRVSRAVYELKPA